MSTTNLNHEKFRMYNRLHFFMSLTKMVDSFTKEEAL